MADPTAVWPAEVADPPSAVPQEGFLPRWGRRSLSLSCLALLFLGVAAALPIALPFALGLDLVARRRWASVRFVLYAAFVMWQHVAGVGIGLFLWLASRPWILKRGPGRGAADEIFLDRHFRVQAWWAGSLFRVLVRLYGIRVVVEGEEQASLARGPLVVMARHTSIADTLLPACFVANRHGLRLRYVLKRELLWNPCMDIFGQRLPNCFVDRRSIHPQRERQMVRRLAAGLSARDGILIYPEGTFFSPQKRAQRLAAIAAKGDQAAHARASALLHTLPPRLGGSLQLIAHAGRADVLFLAHVGFEPARRLRNLVNGRLIGQTIHLRFWRVPHREIPASTQDRIQWLYRQWQEIDRFVGEHC